MVASADADVAEAYGLDLACLHELPLRALAHDFATLAEEVRLPREPAALETLVKLADHGIGGVELRVLFPPLVEPDSDPRGRPRVEALPSEIVDDDDAAASQ